MLTINITALVALLTLLHAINGQPRSNDPKADLKNAFNDCKTVKRDFFCFGMLTTDSKAVGFPEGSGCLAEGATPCNTLIVGRRDPTAHKIQWEIFNQLRLVAKGSGLVHFIVSPNLILIPDPQNENYTFVDEISMDGFVIDTNLIPQVSSWDLVTSQTQIVDATALSSLYENIHQQTFSPSLNTKWSQQTFTSGDVLKYKFSTKEYKADFTQNLNVLVLVDEAIEPYHFVTQAAGPVLLFGRDSTTTTTEDPTTEGPTSTTPATGGENRFPSIMYDQCDESKGDDLFCIGAKLAAGTPVTAEAVGGKNSGCMLKANRNCDAILTAMRMATPDVATGETITYLLAKNDATLAEAVFFATKTKEQVAAEGLPPGHVGIRMAKEPRTFGAPKTTARYFQNPGTNPDSTGTGGGADPLASQDSIFKQAGVLEMDNGWSKVSFSSKDELKMESNGYSVNLATDELFPVLAVQPIATPPAAASVFIAVRPDQASKLLPIVKKPEPEIKKNTTTIAPGPDIKTPKEPEDEIIDTGSVDPEEEKFWTTPLVICLALIIFALIGFVVLAIWDTWYHPKNDVRVDVEQNKKAEVVTPGEQKAT